MFQYVTFFRDTEFSSVRPKRERGGDRQTAERKTDDGREKERETDRRKRERGGDRQTEGRKRDRHTDGKRVRSVKVSLSRNWDRFKHYITIRYNKLYGVVGCKD